MAMEPYAMCSKQEFLERIRSHEISIFEKSNDGSPDPCKVITKYRRSAAGNQKTRIPPRSMHQLSITVHYLVRLLASSFEDNETHFVPAVHFFEDRIRAVQVDFTRSSLSIHKNNNNKECDRAVLARLQVMIARAQILVLYLMSSMEESPLSLSLSKDPVLSYERKFGQTALQTALSSYLAVTQPQDSWNDQMTAFSILSLVNELLLSSHCSSSNNNNIATGLGHVWMEVTLLARKCNRVLGPRTQWAVRFLVRICRGEWQQAIVHLMDDSSTTTGWAMEQYCIDQVARRYLQWKSLQTLNMVLSKGQTINIAEVARLLCIDNDNNGECDQRQQQDLKTVALVKSFGLPMTDTGDNVIFKETDILPPSPSAKPPRSGNGGGCTKNALGVSKPKLSLLQLILNGIDD